MPNPLTLGAFSGHVGCIVPHDVILCYLAKKGTLACFADSLQSFVTIFFHLTTQ